MKLITQLGAAIAAVALGSTAHSATVIGSINFSSGPNGGIILQDLNGNITENLSNAKGVQTWVFPKVDTRTDSFISVPNGQSVAFSEPWIFTPSTPMTPLWTIVGFGNFTFNLASSTIALQDNDFLLIEGIGTLTGDNFEPTPAKWFFSTQGVATEGKFSWSSSVTAVPEGSTAALLSGAMLTVCFFRRRSPL